jgi:hypothetical protein
VCLWQGTGEVILLNLEDMVTMLLSCNIPGLTRAAARNSINLATGAAAPQAVANAMANDSTAQSLRAGAAAGGAAVLPRLSGQQEALVGVMSNTMTVVVDKLQTTMLTCVDMMNTNFKTVVTDMERSQENLKTEVMRSQEDIKKAQAAEHAANEKKIKEEMKASETKMKGKLNHVLKARDSEFDKMLVDLKEAKEDLKQAKEEAKKTAKKEAKMEKMVALLAKEVEELKKVPIVDAVLVNPGAPVAPVPPVPLFGKTAAVPAKRPSNAFLPPKKRHKHQMAAVPAVPAVPAMPAVPVPVTGATGGAAGGAIVDPTARYDFVAGNWKAFIWEVPCERSFVWTDDIINVIKKKYSVSYKLDSPQVNYLMKQVYGAKPSLIQEMNADGTLGSKHMGFRGFTMRRAGEDNEY